MRILVTGAAGFIGSHLVDRLLARGHPVVGLDNFDDFYDPTIKRANLRAALEDSGFELVEGDIRNADALEALRDDIGAIVHLAARAGVRPSIEDPALYQDVNEVGTQRLLDMARRRAIERFVFGSSSSVYGNSDRVPFREDDPVDRPISPYAVTKRAGELMCHAYHHLFGLGTVCLRFFTVYGPRQRPDLAINKFVRLMSQDRAIPRYGDGTTSRDYTYISDILDGIEGALELLERRPVSWEIINLGGNEAVSLSRLIELLGGLLEVEPRIDSLPAQPGDVVHTSADIARARELLGYEPSVSIADGLARFVTWYEETRAGR